MFEIGSVAGSGSGLLADLTAAVDKILAADPRDASVVDLVGDIAGIHTQMQRLSAGLLDRVRVAETDGAHHVAGYATTGAMLTDGLLLSPGQGQAMAATARVLGETLPETAAALSAGDISYAHAVQLRRAVKKLPSSRLAEAEALLVDVARTGNPGHVRAAVDRMVELLSPEAHDQDERDERDRRHFNLSKTLDGWWAVDGHLPPEAGARLSAALEEFAAPTHPGDLRTAAQRRADAIAEVADAALDGTTNAITAVTITADAAAMNGTGATWDASGMPVGLSTFDLAVCQSQLTLVISDRSGIGWKPIAVGMSARFASPAQRAALAVRDGGCTYRGCRRPARRCHAHHVVDWRAGGPTDLSNLVLLCSYHHRMVHLGRSILVADPDVPGRLIALPARRHTTTAA